MARKPRKTIERQMVEPETPVEMVEEHISFVEPVIIIEEKRLVWKAKIRVDIKGKRYFPGDVIPDVYAESLSVHGSIERVLI